ncbi:MAG: T9SS type A sorting domain-containing protein [Sphingobacteriales bacterium]|nr:T9SS type A sorting domain-containing protein [Sphingobacteriales bacterium]
MYNATHQAVAVTYTNADGNYSFANLAYGTYYVAVEVLNHTSDEIMVVLSGSNASSVANSFVDAGDTFEAQASSVQANTVLLNSLSLMPNIANTNSVVIIRSSKNTLSQVNVYDITGKLVASQQGNATQINLSTAGLIQGMYLCNVVDANGNTATCKLIVQ